MSHKKKKPDFKCLLSHDYSTVDPPQRAPSNKAFASERHSYRDIRDYNQASSIPFLRAYNKRFELGAVGNVR